MNAVILPAFLFNATNVSKPHPNFARVRVFTNQ